MSTKEIQAQLSASVSAAYTALRAAEAFADEHKLDFSFSPAYGMGGCYLGTGNDDGYGEEGWNPSSQSC